MMVKKLVNRSAVRAAFHEKSARVPHGFMDDLERDVLVLIRRWGQGGKLIDEESPATDAVFVKQSTLKETVRSATGKDRVTSETVASINTAIAAKVQKAVSGQSSLPPLESIPGKVMIAFLQSEECKKGDLTFEKFFWRWQRPEFRQEWAKRARYKGRV